MLGLLTCFGFIFVLLLLFGLLGLLTSHLAKHHIKNIENSLSSPKNFEKLAG